MLKCLEKVINPSSHRYYPHMFYTIKLVIAQNSKMINMFLSIKNYRVIIIQCQCKNILIEWFISTPKNSIYDIRWHLTAKNWFFKNFICNYYSEHYLASRMILTLCLCMNLEIRIDQNSQFFHKTQFLSILGWFWPVLDHLSTKNVFFFTLHIILIHNNIWQE